MRRRILIAVAASLPVGAVGAAAPGVPGAVLIPDVRAAPPVCAAPGEAPGYYAVDLIPTRQVTGTGQATGTAWATFDRTPFGVALADDGSYRLTLHLEVRNLPTVEGREFVAWAVTPSLDRVVRVGALDASGAARGPVEWNKFLVAVTLEPAGTEGAELWAGPIVLRGMSRSGMMHTMAGHGPFEQQECAAFGY